MLSTNEIGNVGQAQHYFLGHDNYYTKDDPLAEERSSWWGKGAQSLTLEGNVDAQLFTQLLKGQLPDGQQLGKKVDQEIQHRPGFDLTFSAPKSVSILALLGADERIFGAMQRATDKTLSQIERACAQARVTREGITSYENTNNLVVAIFLHDISREADPQLHMHCVVMNMTKRSDGKWRSLASQSGDYGADVAGEVNGFIERVRHHKHHYGAIFRAELAYEMKQLGYDITKTGKNGLFEIAGVSQKAIDTYSQRAKQITAYMKAHGFSGAIAAAVATLKTRQAKKNIKRETLKEVWQTLGQVNNMDAFKEAKNVVTQALDPDKNIHQDVSLNLHAAKDAVQYAIDHLSETQTSIKEIQLINVAMQQGIGDNVTVTHILQTLKVFLKEGKLIPLEQQGEEPQFTTRKLLQYEKDILEAIHKKVENAKPIVSKEYIEAYLSQQPHLVTEQKQAIKTIFSSEQRINILEGSTGSGKTYLIKPMMALAKLNGYRVVFLTPSGAGRVDLKRQLNTPPKTVSEWIKNLFNTDEYDTVSHFIKTQEKLMNTGQVVKHKSILFVDNATLLSSKQMRDLIATAEKNDHFLVPIGDKKSLLSWQSGTPFTQMVDKGAVCARLTQNHRQQETHIKAAVTDTLQSNIDAAFEKIGHRIFSIETKEQRVDRMAAHFTALSPTEQQKTFLLMPTKALCEEMNTAVRERFKINHPLAPVSTQTTVLLPKSMSAAQYQYAHNYSVGNWVRFNENFKSLNIQRGNYLKIHSIQSARNCVTLETKKGDTIIWNPLKAGGKSGCMEVFEEKPRELLVGDTLLWKRGNKAHDIYNGERFKVAAIKKQQLILLRDNQKNIKLDLRSIESRHFDYGYATTPMQKHYAIADNVIAYQNSFSNQSHQRLFYKELSQARQNVWIYTENKEILLKNLQKLTGDKKTAIDTLLDEYASLQGSETPLVSEYLQLLEKAITRAIENGQKTTPPTKTPELLAKEAVHYALAHLAEREAAFEHKAVLEVALTHALGHIDSKTLQAAIQQAEKEGALIRGVYSHEGTRWTTAEAIAIERQILQLAKEEQGRLPPIATKAIIEKHLAPRQPKPEHAQAIQAICTNTDRHLLVQGFAGTGKTTMLKYVELLIQVDPLLKNQGYSLLCLAPTHTAVKELKARGLLAQTLDSFLVNNRQLSGEIPKYGNKLVLALDENSMTSSRRMLTLLEITKAQEIRGIYIGDNAQHSAIEAGKPHTLLVNWIKTIYLKYIERQKDPTLLKAVNESYQKDFAAAFQTLGDRIVEVGKGKVDGKKVDCSNKRLEVICQDYLSYSLSERAKTLVITLGNKDRVMLNALIREGLKAEGELYGQASNATILVPRDMTEVEKAHISNYRKDDQIRFGFTHQTLGIKTGDYLTIRDVDTQQKLLVLENTQGHIVVWPLPTLKKEARVSVEVYSVAEREVMAGDLIRWTRSDAKRGLLSPELAKVESTEQDHILLRHARITQEGIRTDGDSFAIQLREATYQHWDHAYVMTGYSAQSKTVTQAIINLESYRKNLATQAAWIVALTRAEYKVRIYTDNERALLERIIKNPGEKTSALETIGEWEKSSKSQHSATLHEKVSASKNHAKATVTVDPVRHSTQTPTVRKPPQLDVQRITQLLHENVERVVENLLGEPKERNGSQYRYGAKKGSLIVTLQGSKRGLWHDFQTGEGGNLLHLIAKQSELDMKLDFRKVLVQAMQILGTPESLVTRHTTEGRANKSPVIENVTKPQLSEQQKRSLYYARKLARESKSIEGTLAERYLREHRGISLEKMPASFRFHPAIYSKQNEAIQPALLVIAKNYANQVQAVQAIFLEDKSANKAQVKVQKQTWGLPSAGVSVDLLSSNDAMEPVYLAEGPETGLSIFEAIPHANVKITLGKSNFKNIDPLTTGKNIVLCLDNDGNNPHTEKVIHFAAQRLIAMDKDVWIAKPEETNKDYNDILKESCVDAVKISIENAIPYACFKNQIPSSVTLKTAVIEKLTVVAKANTLQTQNAEQLVLNHKIGISHYSTLEMHNFVQQTQKIETQMLVKVAELSKQTHSLSRNEVDKYMQPEPLKSNQETKQKTLEKEPEL